MIRRELPFSGENHGNVSRQDFRTCRDTTLMGTGPAKKHEFLSKLPRWKAMLVPRAWIFIQTFDFQPAEVGLITRAQNNVIYIIYGCCA
jgi:hypothetical protein